MEKMYQQYKSIAEFRIVYINEAHAADSDWSVQYAKDKGINNHTNYEERCTSADMLLNDKNLTIPTIIDGMDNKVNKAYSAWPDRIFLIRKDGRLAVAAAQGPWGFAPALKQTSEWLAAYKETGDEPELDKDALQEAIKAETTKANEPQHVDVDENAAKQPAKPIAFSTVIGRWNMETDLQGRAIKAVLTLSKNDAGQPSGTWDSMGQSFDLKDVAFDGTSLTFSRSIGGGQQSLKFSGIFDGDSITGQYSSDFGNLPVTGQRANEDDAVDAPDNGDDDDGDDDKEASNKIEDQQGRPLAKYTSRYPMGRLHSRPIVEQDGKRLLWAKGDPKGEDAEWFDMTDSMIDPVQFQYGIGKDRIPAINNPTFSKYGSKELADVGINDETSVIGFERNGISRAYPISILNGHEVVNDNFGGTPFAVCW